MIADPNSLDLSRTDMIAERSRVDTIADHNSVSISRRNTITDNSMSTSRTVMKLAYHHHFGTEL
jgi:hypothetical protein